MGLEFSVYASSVALGYKPSANGKSKPPFQH